MGFDPVQARKALKKANEVRIGTANLKKQVASGKLSFEKALARKAAQPMPVGQLITAINGWGGKRMKKMLHQRLDLGAMIEMRRVRDLTKREKELIVKGVKDADFWVLPK